MSEASTRSERREAVRAQLAKVKEHLTRNGLFALSGDEIDTLALQQAQWEATAYAAVAEILYQGHPQSGSPDRGRTRQTEAPNRDLPSIPFDVLRPRLWRIVRDLIKDDRGDEDLEMYYDLLDRTFSWVKDRSDSMPHGEPELRDWLQECYLEVLNERSVGSAKSARPPARWRRPSALVGGVSMPT